MILVDGVVRAEISAADRGLAYGDGVFRTLRARKRAPEHWDRHYAKLAHDCAALKLACPGADALVHEVGAACEHDDCAVKIVVTRGPAERGYRYTDGSAATRIVIGTQFRAYPAAYHDTGVKARVCTIRLGQQPALAGVKHLNRLESVLARAEWHDPDIAEGLLCDAEGYAICGTMTNLFLVKEGSLVTPRLDRCGVAGVTRERVMDACGRLGFDCEVRNVACTELLAMDEVFLVNSLVGVWPVRELEGRTWARGAVTRRLQRALDLEDRA